ncbi:MAG TPA: hypothetical protein VLL52_19490 [Anaerolineae bacterium]|nr:hypothetical protein [Anaerolineae bacterium]
MKVCAYCEARVAEGALRCPQCDRSHFVRDELKNDKQQDSFAGWIPVEEADDEREGWRQYASQIYWLVGVVSLMLAGVLAWHYSQTAVIECSRQEVGGGVSCQVTVALWGVLPLGDGRLIENVQDARYEQRCDTITGDGQDCVFLIILDGENGGLEIEAQYSLSNVQAGARQIHDFIYSDALEVRVREVNWMLTGLGLLVVALPFAIVGVLAIRFGLEERD